jgi:uncharacterized protein
MTAIFDLIDKGDADGIRALLVSDPEARDARDDRGVSPLMRAVYAGGGPAFEALVDSSQPTDPWDRLVAGYTDGLPAHDAWSADGFSPLHLAAFAHNVPAAEALLEAGADPNVVAHATFARVTPLGTCAFANDPEVTRLLLEAGADPSIAENERSTPLAVAEANGHTKVAELLRSAAR